METKGGLEEARWTAAEDAARVRQRVKRLVVAETYERIKVWAWVRLEGGDRSVDVASERDYRDGSGVRQVFKRLETVARTSTPLHKRLEELRELSRVKR